METFFPQDFKELPVISIDGGKKWIIHNPDQTNIPIIIRLLLGDIPLISVVNWNDQYELLPKGLYNLVDTKNKYIADMSVDEINIYLINNPITL